MTATALMITIGVLVALLFADVGDGPRASLAGVGGGSRAAAGAGAHTVLNSGGSGGGDTEHDQPHHSTWFSKSVTTLGSMLGDHDGWDQRPHPSDDGDRDGEHPRSDGEAHDGRGGGGGRGWRGAREAGPEEEDHNNRHNDPSGEVGDPGDPGDPGEGGGGGGGGDQDVGGNEGSAAVAEAAEGAAGAVAGAAAAKTSNNRAPIADAAAGGGGTVTDTSTSGGEVAGGGACSSPDDCKHGRCNAAKKCECAMLWQGLTDITRQFIRCRSSQALMDSARHVIKRILNPRFLGLAPSCNVASSMWQALFCGRVRRALWAARCPAGT